jgi:pimeloyl-ACP methyl ester carboxylesterase
MNDLIMIPALGCDDRLYANVAAALEEFVSPKTIIGTRDTFAACIEEVLALAPGRFIVMGTSFGGRLALELTLAFPQRILGLIVIGATCGAVTNRANGLRRSERLRGGEFEDVIREMSNIISHLPGPNGPSARDLFVTMAHTLGPEVCAKQSDALAQRIDLWPRMTEISCPVLMLWGHEDQFADTAEGMKMAAIIPRGRFVEITECGHLPTVEAPHESAEVIRHWLADFRFT